MINRRLGKLKALSLRKRETWSPRIEAKAEVFKDFFVSVFTDKRSIHTDWAQQVKLGTGRMKNHTE